MRNNDFVSDGFLALIAAGLVVLLARYRVFVVRAERPHLSSSGSWPQPAKAGIIPSTRRPYFGGLSPGDIRMYFKTVLAV
jgi:hypothetical protein